MIEQNEWWQLKSKTFQFWLKRENWNIYQFYLILNGADPEEYTFIKKIIYRLIPNGLYTAFSGYDELFETTCEKEPWLKNHRNLLYALKDIKPLVNMARVAGASDLAIHELETGAPLWEREKVPNLFLDEMSPSEWIKLANKAEVKLPEYLKFIDDTKIGHREEQIKYILEVIKSRGHNPMAIPLGAKREIKKICLEQNNKLFTDSGFDEAWYEASNSRKVLSIEGKERYTKGKSGD